MRSPKIVLTADETMMSQYRGGIGTGFAGCMPQGFVPDSILMAMLFPPVPRKDGRAVLSDFGLRMIEASLLDNGFEQDEVAVVHPKDLDKMVGPNTEICGVSGHDLLGINPPTSTFVDLTRRGPPLNRVKFLDLMKHRTLKDLTIVIGGKSAWQVADTSIMDKLGIDHVHLGEGETSVPPMFRSILNGEEVPRIVTGEDVPVERIPNIRGGTIHGLVEISRGCGRGCSFCTPGMQKVRHKTIDHIRKDVETNLHSGHHDILLHNEDMLRYGTTRIEANEEAVMALLRNVLSVNGVDCIGFSHIALASAYHHPHLVEDMSELIMSLPKQKFIGAQTGLETGSPKLMAAHMAGKALPSSTADWSEIVKSSLGLLKDNHWIIFSTLVVGLPGETEDDVMRTIEMIDDIDDSMTMIVPMGFVSMAGARLSEAESFGLEKMTPAHWTLFGKCMEHDFTVARQVKGAVLEGPLWRLIGGLFINTFIRRGSGITKTMLNGLPPIDYTGRSNFREPRF